MVSAVFVEPQEAGNVGFLARAMLNFGLESLILVNPCKITEETKARAKHAWPVVKNAKVFADFETAIKGFDAVIGTTGKTVFAYKPGRASITPKELRERLGKNSCIVFGRETTGLLDSELEKCDIVVQIPCSEKYPVLNVSHAAAIILYELFGTEERELANKAEKDALFASFDSLLGEGIKDRERISKIFRNVVERSAAYPNEVHGLTGAFREIGKK